MAHAQPANRRRWWLDPLVWLELNLVFNVAFLALDIAIAHAVNAFEHPGEWVPIAFSIAATLALIAAMVIGGLRPWAGPLQTAEGAVSPRQKLARWIGLAVGGASILVGVVGLIWHLQSDFFQLQTIKSLVYTAPFAAPLAYTGVGLLLMMNRMVDSRSSDWARWVLLLVMGGFVGNFVLCLADHAQNDFFYWTEWIGVISSALAVGALTAVVLVPGERLLRRATWVIVLAQIAVGTIGFGLHVQGALARPAVSLWSKFLFGAPAFAPLLFADLAILAVIGLWALEIALKQEAAQTLKVHNTRTTSAS